MMGSAMFTATFTLVTSVELTYLLKHWKMEAFKQFSIKQLF